MMIPKRGKEVESLSPLLLLLTILRISNALSTSSNIRWGILSAGRISSDFTKAISITEGAEATAVAARSSSSSREFAKKHNIPQSYGSYDQLFRDPNVDVIYIGSIANSHAELANNAILAGKPVVVEKPLTLKLEDTLSIVDLARKRDVFLMEGIWTRCFPAMRKVRDMVAAGEIGDVVCVQGDFGWSTANCAYPEERIWDPESGGMTLDIGMYMAQLGQVAFPHADVERIQAMGTTKHGVDHTVMTNIMYRKNRDENGKGFLQFYVTGEANTEERVVLQGTKGRIIIEPPSHTPIKLRVCYDEGRTSSSNEVIHDFDFPDDSFTTWNHPKSIGFTYQIKEVCNALRNGEKECRHFTLDESVQTSSILGEIMNQVYGKKIDASYEEQLEYMNGDKEFN